MHKIRLKNGWYAYEAGAAEIVSLGGYGDLRRVRAHSTSGLSCSRLKSLDVSAVLRGMERTGEILSRGCTVRKTEHGVLRKHFADVGRMIGNETQRKGVRECR